MSKFQNLISAVKILLLVVAILASGSFALAAYNNPVVNPVSVPPDNTALVPPNCPESNPGCNQPINVSGLAQKKTGLLDLGFLSLIGNKLSELTGYDPAKGTFLKDGVVTPLIRLISGGDNFLNIFGSGTGKVGERNVRIWDNLTVPGNIYYQCINPNDNTTCQTVNNSNSSGVSKIIAGTNIVLTKKNVAGGIDPSDGTGEVIVNSSAVCFPGSKIGDANGDGNVTNADAQWILDTYGDLNPPPVNICCLDTNKDGKVGGQDAVLIRSIVEKLTVDTLGYCPNGSISSGPDLWVSSTDGTSISPKNEKNVVVDGFFTAKKGIYAEGGVNITNGSALLIEKGAGLNKILMSDADGKGGVVWADPSSILGGSDLWEKVGANDMKNKNTGNVGIGTAPLSIDSTHGSSRLSVANDSGVTLQLDKVGGASLQFSRGAGVNGYQIYDTADGSLGFDAGGVGPAKMILTADGNVRIGQSGASNPILSGKSASLTLTKRGATGDNIANIGFDPGTSMGGFMGVNGNTGNFYIGNTTGSANNINLTVTNSGLTLIPRLMAGQTAISNDGTANIIPGVTLSLDKSTGASIQFSRGGTLGFQIDDNGGNLRLLANGASSGSLFEANSADSKIYVTDVCLMGDKTKCLSNATFSGTPPVPDQPSPSDARWSDWSPATCNNACDVPLTQKRTCTEGTNGGKTCAQIGGLDTNVCPVTACVPNTDGYWSGWSLCSATTCGLGGTQERACLDQSGTGKDCSGIVTQLADCPASVGALDSLACSQWLIFERMSMSDGLSSRACKKVGCVNPIISPIDLHLSDKGIPSVSWSASVPSGGTSGRCTAVFSSSNASTNGNSWTMNSSLADRTKVVNGFTATNVEISTQGRVCPVNTGFVEHCVARVDVTCHDDQTGLETSVSSTNTKDY